MFTFLKKASLLISVITLSFPSIGLYGSYENTKSYILATSLFAGGPVVTAIHAGKLLLAKNLEKKGICSTIPQNLKKRARLGLCAGALLTVIPHSIFAYSCYDADKNRELYIARLNKKVASDTMQKDTEQ